MNDIIDAINRNIQTVDGTYIGQDGLLHCTKCGGARQMRITIPTVGERVVSIFCECMKKELENKKERERLEEIEKARNECFTSSNMHNWTFENSAGYDPELERVMKNYVKHYTEFKKNGKGLILYGPVGTGKTYLAACVANALIDEGRKVLMTNFATITNKLQGMWEGKQEYINRLNQYSLLIIDDLGAERNTEYMQEQVFNVIDARYSSGLPMIITTNLTKEELKKPSNIGCSRIYERILERCHPVEVASKSKRRAIIRDTFDETKALLGE